jgi:SAM-dependent methyltransferase
MSRHRFYAELAPWWPLVSPVEDYASEAAEFLRVLDAALPSAKTLLELGSGGGHNAFYLKRRYELTLSDLSDEMLAVSKRLNPECEHVRGDMRSLELGRTFDVVFVHDAVDYMLDEADLERAMATAFRHCRAGGVALFVPDAVKETLELDTDVGGTDGPDGRGIRFLEWSHDPDPTDTSAVTEYSFLVKNGQGTVRSFHETHTHGVFARARWRALMERVGFAVDVLTERTDEDRTPRDLFLGRRPEASAAARTSPSFG